MNSFHNGFSFIEINFITIVRDIIAQRILLGELNNSRQTFSSFSHISKVW